MKKLNIITLLGCTTFCLTACMSSNWVAGENPQNFDESHQRCQMLANERYPMSKDDRDIYKTAMPLNTSHCTFQKEKTFCIPQHHTAKPMPSSQNQINRSTYFHQCMIEKGWTQKAWTRL